MQVLSGIVLAIYYVRGVEAWNSVVEITREIRGGWILRLIHRNTASFVFVVLFVHFFRGMVQASFYLVFPWLRGWLLMILTIGAAFLGYVLPWGQMSFWGATVIINLLRVLPRGKSLVVWLWGGFYVSSYTCRFFFAVHYIVPFVVLAIIGAHLFFLHFSGRSVPSGIRERSVLKTKFLHIFTYKDLVNLVFIWFIWFVILISPDWSADPVNFAPSDLSNSPLHIQPEWYFLHLYAILRSIPNKVGGLVAFVIAIIVLISLIFLKSFNSLKQRRSYHYIIWAFIGSNLILLWLGMQPVEAPFIIIGQVVTCFYFSYFLSVFLLDSTFFMTLWRTTARIADSW